ncbi:hypothetical protein IM660_05060 [Ruania alkalisoli]|uniref:Uncharacterized protein n=1 Tax=Ruania alkalisoli TaxID=2779775 RepID=A0A7M1SVP0_9MICO|nr:hypothetical protein [Ruania alkalisoli]QOR71656.1 hypothetical protein IM660_05060 [Ruania alkalisoli]
MSETPVSTHHWREYPLGLAGTIARDARRTLVPMAAGLLAAFGAVFASGLLAEEGILWDALYDLGMGGEVSSAVVDAVDQTTRLSLLVLLILGYLVGALVCLALAVQRISTSHALVTAARNGASREAVPAPLQVERVVTENMPIIGFLIMTIGVFGLFALMLIGYAVVEGWGEGLLVGLACGALTVVVIAGLRHIHRVTLPAHRERRQQIAAHWTTSDETAAWSHARRHGVLPAAGNTGRDPRVRIGSRITGVAGALAGAALLLLQALIVVTHPDAERWPGGSAGPRATLDDGTEQLVDLGMWGFAALIVAVLAGAAIGNVVTGAGITAERRYLHRVVVDPQAARPEPTVLAAYAEHRSVPMAQVLAALAGIGLVLGPVWMILSTVPMDIFAASTTLFAGLRWPAVLITAVAVGLLTIAFLWTSMVNQADAELRNLLLRRWPVLPRDTKDSDGNVRAARVGPALSGDSTDAA